jgi:hypothetical protein
VSVTNNGGSTSYTFTGNDTFTFEFTDAYGNTGSVTATVTWIDKTPPTCSIDYTPTTDTNQDVVAILTGCSEAVTVMNNSGSTNHTFTGNGSFTFDFSDHVGNTGSALATVTRIDKTSPEALSVIYSPNTATSGSVTVTLTLSELVEVIS